MKVIDIKSKKNKLKEVCFDDGQSRFIDGSVLEASGVKEGDGFSIDEVNALSRKSDEKRCKSYAFYLLDFKSYTKAELTEKLRAKYCEDIAGVTVNRLEELGLIGDKVIAQRLAEHYLKGKMYGRKKAVFEMMRRGIDKDMANEYVNSTEIDTVNELERFIRSKYSNKLFLKNGEQKVFAALARRGHNFDDIKAAINRVKSGGADDDFQS